MVLFVNQFPHVFVTISSVIGKTEEDQLVQLRVALVTPCSKELTAVRSSASVTKVEVFS